MITFHEGLPRSGKSYEATKEYIVPSLKKGRKVFARINGINHEKFAELAGISLELCKQLLIHIPESDVFKIYDVVENDSLVIIDELQNFFPSGRMKLTDEMTKFVTEHGHRGLDIITMGQSLSDCHNLWRRRTQRKIQFLKLDMLGKEDSYKWTAFQGANKPDGEIMFTKINSGSKKYDSAYFGAYLSHQPDTENKGNLTDSRLNVFNNSTFKFGVPAFFVVLGFAVYWLYGFFNPEPETPVPVASVPANAAPAQPQQQTSQAAQKPPRPKDWDYVMENNERYNPKLTYLSAYKDFVYDALVVWVDETDRVKDMAYKADLITMGYSVTAKSNGLHVAKGKYKSMFRWKPDHDPYGAVPQATKDKL